MKTITTLVVIHDDQKILLAMKKRGFGAGLWNGYGGKVLDGESIEQSALRELQEESGLTEDNASKVRLVPRGQIIFRFKDTEDEVEVNLFSANDFSYEVIETEEMRPKWFSHDQIPYGEMWKDDPFWIPIILKSKNVRGEIHFDNKDNQNILKNTIEEY